MSANPYAPPRAALVTQAPAQFWRDGNALVVPVGSTLPPRCVKCNQPALEPMHRRKLSWHHPGWFLLIFVNILLYIIAALIVRKKAEVTCGLCARHLRTRRIYLAIGWGGLALGVALVFSTPPVGVLVVLAGVITGMIGSRIVHPGRITKEEVWLRGCGEEFLDSAHRESAAAGPPPIPAGMGTCPNCAARLSLDAGECSRCHALFGTGSEWQVVPAAAARAPDQG